MTSFLYILLLATTEYGLCCAFARTVYKPFGPVMCKELCRKSDESFSFFVDDLSCWRISPRYAETKDKCFTQDTFTCFRKSKTVMDSTSSAIDIINHFPDRGSADMTPPTHCVNNLTLTWNMPNISLYQASEEGNLCVVMYLLSHSQEHINTRGKYGRTPVMVAAVKGHMAVFAFLVSKGCDLSTTDNNKNTILHLACQGGNTDIVRYLMATKYDAMERRQKYGYTPVLCAVSKGHRAVLDILMRMCCNMRVVSQKKLNLLHAACSAGHLGLLKYILSQDILDIESRNDIGQTPLLIAVQRGRQSIVDTLVKKGCNLKALDSFGNGIVHLISWCDHADLLAHLVVTGVISSCKECTALSEESDTTPLPYNMVISLNHAGYNMLHVACISDNRDVIEYILANKILDSDCRSRSGRTPMMLAAFHGLRKLVEYFVKIGSDLSAVTDTGDNILHLACVSGHIDTVKYLLTLNNVAKREKNNKNQTPLQVAELKHHVEIVAILKEYGL